MELLEKHFEIALETPDGIKKLRELILTLGMQGKLVKQNPKEEPVNELLENIKAAKIRLSKELNIKNISDASLLKDEFCPYLIPNEWVWLTLGDVVLKLTDGSHNPPKDAGCGYPMLSSQNVNFGKIDFASPSRYVSEEDFITENRRTQIAPGDVLLTIVASLGRTAVVPKNSPKFVMQRSIAVLKTTINAEFLSKFLSSPFCQNYYMEHGKGTAQKGIYLGQLAMMPIPLPPFHEQKRIVDKIDQLMALCDKLESERNERDQKRLTIHTAATNQLFSSTDQKQFTTSWSFITSHFDELYSVPENVADLKKTILQLAVMGKLVPQDPKDQPASELLKEIEAEKKRLVKEGKIKKVEELPEIKPEDIPYAAPKGWDWVRLGNITSKITDGEHQTPPRIISGKRLLSAKNVRDGFIDYTNCDFISEEHYVNSRKRCCPEIGDLLIVSVGGTIGRTSLVEVDDQFAIVRSVALIKPLKIFSKYLRFTMNSNLLQDTIAQKSRGGAQPCLYLSEIVEFIFPLPPLAEQKRIVAKVDQLMQLCDSLDQHIKDSTEKKSAILNAVLAGV